MTLKERAIKSYERFKSYNEYFESEQYVIDKIKENFEGIEYNETENVFVIEAEQFSAQRLGHTTYLVAPNGKHILSMTCLGEYFENKENVS